MFFFFFCNLIVDIRDGCLFVGSDSRRERKKSLTFGLGGLVVRLADKFPVLHEVELVAGVELPGAHDAGEAVQMVHVVLRPAHHLRRRDALLAPCALGAVPPDAQTATTNTTRALLHPPNTHVTHHHLPQHPTHNYTTTQLQSNTTVDKLENFNFNSKIHYFRNFELGSLSFGNTKYLYSILNFSLEVSTMNFIIHFGNIQFFGSQY